MEYTWLGKNIPAEEKRGLWPGCGAFERCWLVVCLRLAWRQAVGRRLPDSLPRLRERSKPQRKSRVRKNAVMPRNPKRKLTVSRNSRSFDQHSFLRHGRE